MTVMIKILFVCHGNICRSPMAEYIFKKLIKEQGLLNQFQVDSAATSREEIGNDIYPPAKKCLAKHGVDFGVHHAKQITATDLTHYDYIIAMERFNLTNLERLLGPYDKYHLLLDFTDEPGNIADPWYSGEFELAYSQIVKGCEGLLKKLQSR